MRMTRRQLVSAALSAGVGMGQSTREGFEVKSPSGLMLARHGDPQRPSVALFLPGDTNPSAVIEMPEHAWRKRKATDDQAWFYRMYSSDPSLKGEVKWRTSGNTVSYEMKTPSGFRLNSRASLESDGVAITHEVVHESEPILAVIEAPTCVKLYRPFTDVFLERTYVHHPEGLELIASETPERFGKNAEEWLPCRYIVQCGIDSKAPDKRVERLDGVTRYFKSRAADIPFLPTESQPGGWTAATHSIGCPALFTNPARTCHHADPRAQSGRGGRTSLALKLYIVKGTPRDAWDLVSKRDLAGQV